MSGLFAGWSCSPDHVVNAPAPSPPEASESPSSGTSLGTAWSIDAHSARILFSTLRDAYIARDLGAYRTVFADDFTFVFSPGDLIDPPEWGLADELAAHENLFTDAAIRDIDLRFEASGPVPSSEYPGTFLVNFHEVNLQITLEHNGEIWIYRVLDGQARFYLRLSNTGPGLREWRIWRWEDQPIEPTSRSEQVTWGAIKNLYR